MKQLIESKESVTKIAKQMLIAEQVLDESTSNWQSLTGNSKVKIMYL